MVESEGFVMVSQAGRFEIAAVGAVDAAETCEQALQGGASWGPTLIPEADFTGRAGSSTERTLGSADPAPDEMERTK